jgi:hypothetical protein
MAMQWSWRVRNNGGLPNFDMRVLELRNALRCRGLVCGPNCGYEEENGSDSNSIQSNRTIHDDFPFEE